MERWLQDRYARAGERYLLLFQVFVVGSAVLLAVGGTLTLHTYVDLDLRDGVMTVAVAAGSIAAALIWSSWATTRTFWHPTVAWMRAGRGRDGADEAWSALVRFPIDAVGMTLWRCVVVAAVPVMVFVTLRYDLAAGDVAAVTGALLAASVFPVVLNGAVLELYLRPVVREIAPYTSVVPVQPRRWLSLRRRLLIAMPLVNVTTGLIAASLSTGRHAAVADLRGDVAVAILVSSLVSLAVVALLVSSVLEPVDALAHGMEEVRAGDLATRVPALANDELGALTRNFNAMANEIQHNRERLVVELEDERRRLRRDLHDGIGPTLAAIRMQLETAALLVDSDPARAKALLGDVAGDTGEVVVELRRLVHALRPPALDELGLVGALRETVAAFAVDGTGAPEGTGGPLAVTVDADGVDELPAAVEVAAFRIAQEAITNVVKHAGATRAVVRLRRGDALDLEIEDDGAGIAAGSRRGVGMSSMRERAAAVGGTCSFEPVQPHGTRVLVSLPLVAT